MTQNKPAQTVDRRKRPRDSHRPLMSDVTVDLVAAERAQQDGPTSVRPLGVANPRRTRV